MSRRGEAVSDDCARAHPTGLAVLAVLAAVVLGLLLGCTPVRGAEEDSATDSADGATAAESATPRFEARPGAENRTAADFGGTVIDTGTQFPSPQTTGPMVEPTTEYPDGLESSYDGQVIDGAIVRGRLTITHDNVVVRNTRIEGTVRYMVWVKEGEGGTCPTGVTLESIEIDGSGAEPNAISIFAPACGVSISGAYIHDVGRAIRISNDASVTDSYIHNTRTWEGAHRSAISSHGGSGVTLQRNTIVCEGTGCSAALTLYGDYAPIEDYLVQENLFASTGSYCVQGGIGNKDYPDGSEIRFIDNQFSTEFSATCGQSGPLASFEQGERGNLWEGNSYTGTNETIEVDQ